VVKQETSNKKDLLQFFTSTEKSSFLRAKCIGGQGALLWRREKRPFSVFLDFLTDDRKKIRAQFPKR
jgi:hypothetical protein